MKLSSAFALFTSPVVQAWVLQHPPASINSALNAKVYFDTSTGNTETCAGYIADAAGYSIQSVGDDEGEMASEDSIIVGAPTWNTGADEERSGTSWDSFLYETLPGLNLAGKKVAVFGCGDQESYGEYYCDAAGELYDQFEKAGCKMYGMTSTEGYDHSESKSERDGKFVGLMFDEDNQPDESEERAQKWVAQLKEEVSFKSKFYLNLMNG